MLSAQHVLIDLTEQKRQISIIRSMSAQTYRACKMDDAHARRKTSGQEVVHIMMNASRCFYMQYAMLGLFLYCLLFCNN